jgi:predicted nucleic acid-binding protein
MMYAMQLTGTYTQASRNDCFALALAKQEQCPLLTGDMALTDW